MTDPHRYDLTPLAPRELSALTPRQDLRIGIHQFPEIFKYGRLNPKDLDDGRTLFEEELVVLRCGLVALASQRARIAGAAAASDIAMVMELGVYLRPCSLAGAAGSRYAPVLFETESAPERGATAALLSALRAVDTRLTSRPAVFDSFDFEGADIIDPERNVVIDVEEFEPGDEAGERELERRAAEANRLFARLSGCERIVLGWADGSARYGEVPVFIVGFTPGGRLGGVMACLMD